MQMLQWNRNNSNTYALKFNSLEAWTILGITIEDNAEVVIDTVPDLVNADQSLCNLDQIVLSEIKST